jgi:hypothetical protein
MSHAARRIGRGIVAVVATVIGFAIVFPLGFAVVAAEPARPMVSVPMPANGRYTIHVVDWDYHTSIILPQPPGWMLGPSGQERAAFVEYAWGDRRFYRDADYRPHAVFATLVLPTASVAYVAGRSTVPRTGSAAQAVYTREVDALTLHALAVELERTVKHDEYGNRAPPGVAVAGFDGMFYDAHGSYLWTRDCNRWTVDRLHAVGLAEHGRVVVFSGQVGKRLRGFTRQAPR